MDALWITHSRDGKTPHCQRLSRRPTPAQWNAAIQLATSFAQGRAGFRQIWVQRTNEEVWYWPDGDDFIADTRNPISRKRPTGWWIIPRRVAVRARRIHDAAILTACRANGGRAGPDEILARLEEWQRTGQWRRIAARISPRHAGPPKRRGRSRERRGRTPARISRGLP